MCPNVLTCGEYVCVYKYIWHDLCDLFGNFTLIDIIVQMMHGCNA